MNFWSIVQGAFIWIGLLFLIDVVFFVIGNALSRGWNRHKTNSINLIVNDYSDLHLTNEEILNLLDKRKIWPTEKSH